MFRTLSLAAFMMLAAMPAFAQAPKAEVGVTVGWVFSDGVSGDNNFTTVNRTGTLPGVSRFSTTWGAGVKVYGSSHVGGRFGVRFTPTYIKSDASAPGATRTGAATWSGTRSTPTSSSSTAA